MQNTGCDLVNKRLENYTNRFRGDNDGGVTIDNTRFADDQIRCLNEAPSIRKDILDTREENIFLGIINKIQKRIFVTI